MEPRVDTTPEQVLRRLEEVERRLAGLESRMGVPETPKLAPLPVTVVAPVIDGVPLELAVVPAPAVTEKHVPPHLTVALPAVPAPVVGSPVHATVPVVAAERSRLQELAERRSGHAPAPQATPTRAAEGGLSQ